MPKYALARLGGLGLAGAWLSMAVPLGSQEGCPPDMVEVPWPGRLCIDRYEWPNKRGERPMIGASALPERRDEERMLTYDATSLCEHVGKRTCTAREWIAACQGTEPSSCNTDRPYRAPDEGKVARRDPAEMARLDQSEPAGSRENCRGASGAQGMIGNAREWVRCDRGVDGWCLSASYWNRSADCTSFIRTHAPNWHFYEISFRCCSSIR